MQDEKTTSVIGLDVSKDKLDVHLGDGHVIVGNDEQGHKDLIEQLESRAVRLVVMEATGGYEADVALALSQHGIPVAVVNPRQVRDFARAAGYLAKTDKIDARVIALFGEKMDVEPQALPDEEQRQLRELVKRRRQLISMLKSDENRLIQAKSARVRKSIESHVKYLQAELSELDDDIDGAIKASKVYAEKAKILQSTPGIAAKSTGQLLAELPELGTVSNKRITTLAGLAPLNRDSGTLRGKRTTWGGRARVRAALYMPTLAAIRWNPAIRTAYNRLIAAGKPKMTAVVAMMRKLLVTLNALLRKKQPWDPKFA